MKYFVIIAFSALANFGYSQPWIKGGNGPTPPGPSILGTNAQWNQPILIHTFGNHIATFTNTNSLTSWAGNAGKGLSIIAPPGSSGNLDLFTSNNLGSSETHAVFGGSGQVSGQNNRFEFISTGASLGNYYSTFSGSGIHRFDRGQKEYGRLGTNNFWRFGENNSGPVFGGLNAARRVEVVDNKTQFRLTYSSNSTGPFTDFFSNPNGNLQILPQGQRVGINANTNPTATIDVFGDARIRDVQIAVPDALFVGIKDPGNQNDLKVRRIDFSGLATDVLLGNGQWGTLPSPTIFANNGLTKTGNTIQLGEPYDFPKTVPLLADREIFLNDNNLIFTGKGRIGIGQIFPDLPSEKLDVVGNARFRLVPEQGGQSLILGLQQGTNANDVELSRLAFPNDDTQVLLGDGTWGTVTGGVDNQNLLTPTIDCITGILTLGIEDGNSVDVDLSCLMSGGGTSTGAHNGTSMSILDPTKVAFGNDLGWTSGQLLNDREIPMNNQSIFFTDNNAINNNKNRIGIGTTSPAARMHLVVNDQIQENFPTALRLENNQDASNGISYGLNLKMNGPNILNFAEVLSVTGGQFNFGVDATAFGGNGNTGLFGRANDALIINEGVVGEAISLTITANQNIGMRGVGRFGIQNHGGNFTASGNSSGTSTLTRGIYGQGTGPGALNYGVYGEASGAATNFAGYFQGDLHVTGQISSTNGTVITSDQQFKTDVNDLTGAMDKINLLQPRTFYYDTTNYSDFNFESDQQMGLIAQQVELVIPTIVSNHIRPAQYDSLGVQIAPEITYKGVEYEELIPLLIAGMQEQDLRIDSLMNINNSVINNNDSLVQVVSDLNARLTLLENCLSNILPALCNANQMAVQQTPEEVQQQLRAAINVNLSNRNAIVLNQNVPNPFAESTVITFTIPGTVQKAQIHFYDGTGKLINSVDIVERGNGQLNVFANDLSTGVYTYSLVADGQIVSTKRMMKQ